MDRGLPSKKETWPGGNTLNGTRGALKDCSWKEAVTSICCYFFPPIINYRTPAFSLWNFCCYILSILYVKVLYVMERLVNFNQSLNCDVFLVIVYFSVAVENLKISSCCLN